jgi:hypothetical protein
MPKPIETIYPWPYGYRFRSRLEARWAVFFDALGVPYEYEKEGYEFNGVRYLPDFWLPAQDCWVEIKGPPPSREEGNKAWFLATVTEKPVYVFWDDIKAPAPEQFCSFMYAPAHLSVYNWMSDEAEFTEFWQGDQKVSPELWAALEGLSCLLITVPDSLALTRKNNTFFINLAPESAPWEEQVYKRALQEYRSLLVEIVPQGVWSVAVIVGGENDPHWCMCPKCGVFGITPQGRVANLKCSCWDDTSEFIGTHHPRLLAAYGSARQARFETRR